MTLASILATAVMAGVPISVTVEPHERWSDVRVDARGSAGSSWSRSTAPGKTFTETVESGSRLVVVARTRTGARLRAETQLVFEPGATSLAVAIFDVHDRLEISVTSEIEWPAELTVEPLELDDSSGAGTLQLDNRTGTTWYASAVIDGAGGAAPRSCASEAVVVPPHARSTLELSRFVASSVLAPGTYVRRVVLRSATSRTTWERPFTSRPGSPVAFAQRHLAYLRLEPWRTRRGCVTLRAGSEVQCVCDGAIIAKERARLDLPRGCARLPDGACQELPGAVPPMGDFPQGGEE